MKKGGAKRQKATLSFDSEIYKAYQEYCDENAMILSKKLDILMKKELEGAKKDG